MTAVLLASRTGPDGGDRLAAEGRDWHWDEQAGAAEASAFMRVAVPEDATGTKGAVQINPQEDVYLLTFVNSVKNAERVAGDLRSEEPLK
ncbi:hypothetical protein [Streptomyces sp. NPDC005301]|uniref:hypothetical protein n=1 Tax=Streptomyces sp. NPDC005301 TaxID=3156874 RepID=UPI0033BAA1E2